MIIVWYTVVTVVRAAISLEVFLIFARLIAEMLFPDYEGKIVDILYYLTEPIVTPVRLLLEKIPVLQELPIDLSFFVTSLVLCVILMFI